MVSLESRSIYFIEYIAAKRDINTDVNPKKKLRLSILRHESNGEKPTLTSNTPRRLIFSYNL